MTDGLLRRWIEPDPVKVDAGLLAAAGGSSLVAQILTRRGFRDPNTALTFLNPNRYLPAAPELLPGITEACERIERAISQAETICVWGDFDVDGQTATTLLVSALRGLGAAVSYHIPVRSRESHGVNWQHLEPILAQGVSLVVTVDTGITAHEAVERAAHAGVDVIVTDHHDPPTQLPQAYSVINPKLVPGEHSLAGLPGAGVAYKLAEALYRRAGREDEVEAFLDLVALGIVADLAAVTQDTRYLLQKGLPRLRETGRAGLQALYEMTGLQAACLTEEHIGFIIGPRLNALGRLDDANPAVEFLTTGDPGRARVLATHLEGLNARRRLLTDQVLRGALAQIEKNPHLLDEAVLVLAHPEWPAGVIGIVASELSERYCRPTILLSAPTGQPARGSARSIEGVNITEAIAAQRHLLLGFGGHPMAAGLSLQPEHLPAFRKGVARAVEKTLGGVIPRPSLTIDGETDLGSLSSDLVTDLERLAPFGPGNPAPVLLIPRLTLLSSNTIGREGDHLQLVVKDEQDRTHKVIWWRGAGWPLPEGVFDLACQVRASNYRGQREIQIEFLDSRIVETRGMDVHKRVLPIIDQRDQSHPLPVLQQVLRESRAVVWAEGPAREKLTAAGVPACDRSQITPSDTLIIWTAPPGRAELQAVLQAALPAAVLVFATDPGDSTPEAFLKRLAGLVRYVVDKTDGTVALDRLSGAAAQREVTVCMGLRWLELRGVVSIETLQDGLVLLSRPSFPAANSASVKQESDQAAALLLSQIQTLLEETAAYRSYFQKAAKDLLL